MEETKNSKKRKRGAPNRKWTDEENMRLLKFLQNNKPFEKPTRQMFYEKFLSQDSIKIQWNLVRYKVKNWKSSYKRVKDGILKELITNKETVYRICPYYDQLDKVFNSKTTSEVEVIKNNDYDFDSSSDIFPEYVLNTKESTMELKPSLSELNFSDESLLEPSSSTKFKEFKQTPSPESNIEVAPSKEDNLSETPFVEPSSSTKPKEVQEKSSVKFANRGVKRIYSPTGLSDMLRVQRSLIEVLKQQCELQTRKMEEELHLKKVRIDLMQDQLNFEKEKNLKEQQIKEKQIESNEKIKALEIDLERERILREFEMKEKIALNELQIKERLAMSNH